MAFVNDGSVFFVFLLIVILLFFLQRAEAGTIFIMFPSASASRILFRLHLEIVIYQPSHYEARLGFVFFGRLFGGF